MTYVPTPTYARHTHQGTIYAATYDIRNNAPTDAYIRTTSHTPHTNAHTHEHLPRLTEIIVAVGGGGGYYENVT